MAQGRLNGAPNETQTQKNPSELVRVGWRRTQSLLMPLELRWSTQIWQCRIHARCMGVGSSTKGRFEMTHTPPSVSKSYLSNLEFDFSFFFFVFVTLPRALCYKHRVGLHKLALQLHCKAKVCHHVSISVVF